MNSSTTLNDTYQITLSKEICSALGIHSGDVLNLEVLNNTLIVKPKTPKTQQIFGKDKDIWEKVDAVDYIREQRLSWRD